jgi:cytochrome c biogenesis protein CcdA
MEAFVGLVLIALGLYRLYGARRRSESNAHLPEGKYHLAYGVGLVHGLAGSGAIVLLVMTEIQGSLNGLLYLLIFGLGSVLGMLLAAGLFSLPFSRRMTNSLLLQRILIYASSLLCIGYGIYILVENLG